MCQLTYINTHNAVVNKFASYLFSTINSSDGNRDGFGIYSNNIYYKSAVNPSLEENWGEFLVGLSLKREKKKVGDPIITDANIMQHVRAASNSLKEKFIDSDHAHPFFSEDFALMHNGTLTPRSEKLEKLYEDKKLIDSQIFLKELQKVANKNSDLPFEQIIAKTMELFDGKFAFLICDRTHKKNYAVRGKTATLHISYIKINNVESGYIINTDKTSMAKALFMLTNLCGLLNLNIKHSLPELIKDETVNLLEDSKITEVGIIKETTKVYVTPPAATYSGYGSATWINGNYLKTEGLKNPTFLVDVSATIISFMDTFAITFEELDEMFYALFNVPFLGANKSMFNYFTTIVIPLLTKFDPTNIKTDAWEKYCGLLSLSPSGAYARTHIQIPFLLSSPDVLSKLYDDELEKINKLVDV